MNDFFNIPSLHLWQFVSGFLFTLLTGLISFVYWLWGIVDKKISEEKEIVEKMEDLLNEIKIEVINLKQDDNLEKINNKLMKINIRINDIYNNFLNISFRNQKEISDILDDD